MTPRRVFLGAFGDPGHAFPMLALGSELAARGHDVVLETWARWRDNVETAGMRFVAAPEYPVFPTRERPLRPYEAVVLATAQTREAVREHRPEVVIHDILTLAPALAAELEGVPSGTLVPHVYPAAERGFPPYALGARLPRRAAGRALWELLAWPVAAGLRRGRSELNDTRAKLGLPPTSRLYGGWSDRLVIVGTLPQLEYPRAWPAGIHVVGPLMWEPPYHDVEEPTGSAPLVVVAPSTAHDPQQRLLLNTITGLVREPVRVLGTWNRRPPPVTFPIPPNARAVEWMSYAGTMPRASLVVCHGGHGTMVRALTSGAPLLVVPHSGDMAENAARADWAGVGVRLPWRLLGPRTMRLAVRRALDDPGLAHRAREVAAWAGANDGPSRAADLVEELAGSPPDPRGRPVTSAAREPSPPGESVSRRGARARTG